MCSPLHCSPLHFHHTIHRQEVTPGPRSPSPLQLWKHSGRAQGFFSCTWDWYCCLLPVGTMNYGCSCWTIMGPSAGISHRQLGRKLGRHGWWDAVHQVFSLLSQSVWIPFQWLCSVLMPPIVRALHSQISSYCVFWISSGSVYELHVDKYVIRKRIDRFLALQRFPKFYGIPSSPKHALGGRRSDSECKGNLPN